MWLSLAHIFRRVGMPARIDFHGLPSLSPGDMLALALLAGREWHRLPPTLTFSPHTDLRSHHAVALDALACAAWPGTSAARAPVPAGFLTDMATLPGRPIVALDGLEDCVVLAGWIDMEDTDDEQLDRDVAAAAVAYMDVPSDEASAQ
jgi:hypothetical protein